MDSYGTDSSSSNVKQESSTSTSSKPAPTKKGKRKATDDDTNSASVEKEKRSRVHFSCVECNRRKQKCDRQEPCNQCIARKVPHLCRPFLNGVEDPNAVEADVRARLARIENLLQTVANQTNTIHQHAVSTPPSVGLTNSLHLHPHNSNQNSGNTPSSHFSPLNAIDDEHHSSHDESGGDGTAVGTMKRGRYYGPSSMASVTSEGRMKRILEQLPGTSLLSGPSSNTLPRSGFSIAESPLDTALRVLEESGISNHNITSLLDSLPPPALRDELLGHYFREIDWTRYKIYEPGFHRRCITFFPRNAPSATTDLLKRLDSGMIKWLPLLFITMAIATLTVPLEVLGSEDDRKKWSRKLYGSARKASNMARALQRDNVDVVMGGLLIARYLLLVRRAAEGFTPLTTAIQQGLYRDGEVLGIQDRVEIELRRRLWAYVYHHERTTSLLLGRPTLISDLSCDTQPPANLDDSDLESGNYPFEGKPLSQPTVMTHVILRHDLSRIMGMISEKVFALKPPPYSTVIEVDAELIAWADSLPLYFRLVDADKSLDSMYPYLPFHRQMLASEFYHTRIIMHRPYILRRGGSDQFAYSKAAAVAAAKADILGRRDFELNKPSNFKMSVGAYWILNSYILLGVALLLEPVGPEAQEIRNLLEVALGRAPDASGRLSEATVRELAIVELFTQRERDNESAPSSPTGGLRLLSAPAPALMGGTNRHGHPAASTTEWGEPDPIDQLLHSFAQAKNAAGGVPTPVEPSPSPWSQSAANMSSHSINHPFHQSHSTPMQPNAASHLLAGHPDIPLFDPGSGYGTPTNETLMPQFPGNGESVFNIPWPNAFQADPGVGNEKDVAFLNALISAISSGEGPTQ